MVPDHPALRDHHRILKEELQGVVKEVTVTVTLEFLGTGTSTGIPVIGCDCPTCTSTDPRDSHLRSSVVIRAGGVTLLVDTTPDFRTQALRAHLRQIDAVLITHSHADHTAGMDELRRFNALQQQRIPMYAPANAVAELERRFGYVFTHVYSTFGFKPDVDLHPITTPEPFQVGDVTVQPIPILHGELPILGYRVGNLAYLTDVKRIPPASLPLLDGVRSLVITGLRHEPHVAHMTVEEAIAAARQIGPDHTWLTHIGHELGPYAIAQRTMPPGVTIACDGLTLRAE